MKTILTNAIQSWGTTLIGSIAGAGEMIAGVNTHDIPTFIKGFALFLLGACAKEK